MSDNTFQSKEFKDNLRRYEEARKTGSSIYLEPEEFTDIAEYYHLHGRLSEALEAVDQALQIFPGATEPLSFKARVAILLGHNAEEAMAFANQIDNKQDLDYYYIVAEIMIADGRIDDAEAYLEGKEDAIDEDDLEDYYLDVATLFADYDAYDDAQRWLDKCDDDSEDDYQEIKGRIALSKGHFKESCRIFNSLIDHDPYRTAYWNQLASAQYLDNKLNDSLESSNFALAINPDDIDALLNKANTLTMLGNFDGALQCYDHYKQLQPQSEVAEMGTAAVMMAQNNLKGALEHWKKADRLCPPNSANKIDICRNLCLVYASLGEYEDAFKTVTRLEEIFGDPSIDTLVLRGYLSLLAEQKDMADSYFEEAYTCTPDVEKENTLYYIAYCYFDCDYMQDAHDLFRKLSSLKGNKRFADIWAFLVRTDYELGLQDEFLDDLKKATERNPHGLQRELSDVFPNGMAVRDFYNYAIHHPLKKK